MTLGIQLSNSAQKFLKRASNDSYQRIVKRLKELSEDPFPLGAKKIVGRKEKVFRIRIGDYRILYVVYPDKNTVLISNIDKRPRVYRR